MKEYVVIPDIHGRADLLDMALNRIYTELPNVKKIIFLGDYIDRGPENAKVITTVRTPPDGYEFITLRGNHEQMILDAYYNGYEQYDRNCVKELFDTFGKHDILPWIDSLPHSHIEGNNIFAHAWYDVEKRQDEQDKVEMIWARMYDSEIWPSDGPYLTHGHTPRMLGPVFSGNRMNLDAGAVFYGKLVYALFEEGRTGPKEIFSVLIEEND